MFSVFDIANFVKEKLDEYQVKFTSDDLPDGGKQFGVDYRGGNFKIRINDNKVSGASIDWSLVKNQTVTDELQRLLEGNLDKGVLQSSVYRSDDPTINVIGSDESGKGDLFGPAVVFCVRNTAAPGGVRQLVRGSGPADVHHAHCRNADVQEKAVLRFAKPFSVLLAGKRVTVPFCIREIGELRSLFFFFKIALLQ